MDRIDLDGESPERRPLERRFFENLLYYAGNTNAVWGELGLRAPRAVNPNAGKYTSNLILPKVLRAVAKLEQVNGQFAVAPKSSARTDRHAAKTASLVFDHLRQVTRFQKHRRRATTWAAICGSCFYKTTWDPKRGVPKRYYIRSKADRSVDAMPHYDDQLREEKERQGLYQDIPAGEIKVEIVNPFQFHWDPNAKDEGIEGCEWVAQVTAMHVDKIKERWGVEVTPDGDERGAQHYERQIAFLADGRGLTGPYAKWLTDKMARVVEFWEVPLRSNKQKGRYILTAGSTVIRDGVNHYATTGSPLPFAKQDWFPMPGRFIGQSLVEQLRGPQKEHNDSRTHSVNFRKTNGHPPVYLPKGCGVKPMQVAGIHTPIYEYNSAYGPPVFGNAPQLPPYIFELSKEARSEMNEISAQADPSNSKLPGQIRAAAGIQMMQADNNAILTPTSESMLEAIEEVGTQMLQLAGLNYDTPRVTQVIGKGGDFDVEAFTGADLRGHYEVKVFGQPGQLETSETYQAKIMTMVELGVLNMQDPTDRMLAQKALNMGTESEIVNTKLRQEHAAERVLARLIDEPMYVPDPMPWQQPQIYLRVFEDFMNSMEFEELDGFTQKKVVISWEGYSKIAQEQLQAQLELMQASQGAPGQKGEASAPKTNKAN